CPRCGRAYDKAPKFCLGCGAKMSTPPAARPRPGFPRGPLVAIIASVVVLLMLAGGITALVIVLNRPAEVDLPLTVSELKSSIGEAQKYLNEKGRSLSKGRVEDAPIYSVSARLDTGDSSLSGEETVLFTNRTGDSLEEMVFRVYANSPTVRGEGKVSVTDARADGDEAKVKLSDSLLTVTLPETLAPGEETLVSFSFEESVPKVTGGMGGLEGLLGKPSGGYGVFGHSDSVYDLGYLMPIITPYRDGSWDTRKTPSFGDAADFECAYFNVAIDVPSGYVVAATGTPTGKSGGAGRDIYSFSAGPVRDFSVQASPDYKVETKTVGSTLVSSYYVKGSEEKGKEVLEFGCNALTQYSDHFGPYPYTRFNICEAPLSGGAAGMEFTGQIMLAGMLYGNMEEDLLPEDLGGEELGDLMGSLLGGLLGDKLEFVTAHEVCHQWWGMSVGGDSIGHPWQDESLTNYCSVLYFRWQHGEKAANEQLEMQLVMPYSTGALMGGGDAVADTPVDGFESQEQYMAAVYSKGALFFDALEEQMGTEAFEKSLKEYYETYVFLNPTPDDLMNCFKSNSSDPAAVDALHQRWIKEKHGDEDISSTLPGMELFDDLMKDLEDGLDLGPLKDLIEDLMNGGEDNSDGSTAPLPTHEPAKSI
ncbi:MAG: M1 family metallopeptidase, partial [Actinobacteria bacterium]|nr:M1 family metallopeptidase [Actinomycetota bacterium]